MNWLIAVCGCQNCPATYRRVGWHSPASNNGSLIFQPVRRASNINNAAFFILMCWRLTEHIDRWASSTCSFRRLRFHFKPFRPRSGLRWSDLPFRPLCFLEPRRGRQATKQLEADVVCSGMVQITNSSKHQCFDGAHSKQSGGNGWALFALCCASLPPLFILSRTSDDFEEGRLAQPCIKQCIFTVETHAS